MSYIWAILGNYFAMIILLFPVYFIYIFTREFIRSGLHLLGFRVFTIKELKKLGLIKEFKDGVFESESSSSKPSKTFDAEVVSESNAVWSNVALELESFNEHCKSLPAPKFKRKRKY